MSIDGTHEMLVEKYKNDKTVHIYQSDKGAETSIIFDNPNQYAGNEDIHQRIIRSYNSSINIIKMMFSESEKVCFFLDVDEYMVCCDPELDVKKSLSDINFEEKNRLLLLSFDMMPPESKKFDKNMPVYLQSNKRWSEDTRFNKTGEFSMRTKIGVLIDSCDSITSVHSGDIRTARQWSLSNIQLLSDKMIICNEAGEYNKLLEADKNRIRIFHYRDLPQSERWNLLYDEEDNSVINIMMK
jgi:flagellar assembly factor FliW